MRVIIAGSRHMPESDYHYIEQAVKESRFNISEVVCGMAKGADLFGKRWAETNNIPVAEFSANWSQYGRAAGPIRNAEMAKYADALIVFIYPGSRGSKNMLTQMTELKKPVHVKEF